MIMAKDNAFLFMIDWHFYFDLKITQNWRINKPRGWRAMIVKICDKKSEIANILLD